MYAAVRSMLGAVVTAAKAEPIPSEHATATKQAVIARRTISHGTRIDRPQVP